QVGAPALPEGKRVRAPAALFRRRRVRLIVPAHADTVSSQLICIDVRVRLAPHQAPFAVRLIEADPRFVGAGGFDLCGSPRTPAIRTSICALANLTRLRHMKRSYGCTQSANYSRHPKCRS